MAVTSGFFNALNHDRMYNASAFNTIFDGILEDGVFSTVGNCLNTVANTGMTVKVQSGRAWFNHTWTVNDSDLTLDVEDADVYAPRYDAVVLEVNTTESVRANSIKMVSGTPSLTPVKPTMTSTEYVHQYALAYIYVGAGVTSIVQSNIENNVGNDDCPFCTGPMQQLSIEQIVAGWEHQFDTWLETIQEDLTPTQAAGLAAGVEKAKDYGCKIATANGGTASHLTASVIDFDDSVDVKQAIRIIPAYDVVTGADLAVSTVTADGTVTHAGTAKPIYASNNSVIADGDLRAGVPYDLTLYNGKYFFKLSGARDVEPGDVTFWDTDGTILYKYDNDYAATMQSLPPVPSKASLGLVADGWNWTLEDIHNQIEHCPDGTIDIGPHYKHSDGGSSIWVDLSSGNKKLGFWCSLSGASSSSALGITIDWGDGSATESVYTTSVAKYHTYSSNGTYAVHITNDAGVTYKLYNWSVSPNTSGSGSHGYPRITRIVIGSGMDLTQNIDQNVSNLFEDVSTMYELISASDRTAVNADFFLNDNVICGIVPRTVTTSSGSPDIRDATYLPSREYIVCLPYTFATRWGYGLAVKRLCVPYGGNFTSWSLAYGYWCEKFGVPDSITNLTVPKGTFLTEFTVPSSVTAITSSSSYMSYCGLTKLRFEGTTPPTAENAISVPPNCVISVPTGYLSTYTSATNYPDSAAYTYIEED